MSKQSLTDRELEVARLVAAEKTNKEIAHALKIQPATVRGHLEAIYLKLEIHTRVGLALWVAGHDVSGQR